MSAPTNEEIRLRAQELYSREQDEEGLDYDWGNCIEQHRFIMEATDQLYKEELFLYFAHTVINLVDGVNKPYVQICLMSGRYKEVYEYMENFLRKKGVLLS